MKLTSWDTVDAALARLATLERRKLKAKFAGDRRMARIKERLKAIFKPLDRDWKRLLGQLERWTLTHQDDLKERTRRMAHGAVRLQKTPEAIVSDLTDDEIVARLEAAGLTECVRNVRSPNREKMHELTPEQLEQVGCRKDSRDLFKWQLAGETEWR
jgi:phage host-nuclease inhibitor protein Gam